jgi:hypothetical protein
VTLATQLMGAAKELDLAIEPTGPYTVRLGSADSAVEAEVCRLRLFAKVHGVRFRRLAGSSEAYKTLCAQLLGAARF